MNNETANTLQQRSDYYSHQMAASKQQLLTERRDHRTTRKYLTAYRWIALIGWVAFLVVLTAKEI